MNVGGIVTRGRKHNDIYLCNKDGGGLSILCAYRLSDRPQVCSVS